MMPKVPVLAIVNMQIFIDKTRERTFTLDVNSNDTINDVKLRIGGALDQQNLIYSGEELENGRTLFDYNIKNGNSIELMLEPTKKLMNAMMII
jgi:hypothetical protein